MDHWHYFPQTGNFVRMNLIICGILSSAAILYCVLFDETLMFNMMMCVFCLVAIISLWSGNNPAEAEDSGKTSQEAEKQDKQE